MIKNFTRLFIHFSFVAIAGLFLNDLAAQGCVTATYTMDPLPTAGAYQPGQVVEICGSITYYQQTGANWIHGIIPTFPSGWVQTSFTNVSSPATCSGSGVWLWMPNGVPGATCTAGWYFDSPVGGPFDGNPGNNWGDPCSVFNWEFCMTATVGTPEGGGAIGCGGPGNPLDGESILPIFAITGDGECGSWGGACSCCSVPSTPPGPIEIDCCDAEAGVSPGTLLICETGSFNLIDELLPPYTTGTWQGPAGYTGNGSATGPFNPANLAINPPGEYTYTVLGTDGCESTSTITMEINDMGIVQYPGYCDGVDVPLINLSTNVTLPPGGTWYFPNGTVVPGGILSPVTNNHPAGIYTYEFYNSGNCLTTASLDITLGTGGGGTACNTVIDVCSTDASFFLLDVMSCTLNPGGAWIHELLGPPISFYDFYFTSTVLINPSTLPASSLFSYAVGVPGCNLQIITLTVNLYDPVDVGDFTQASICVSEAPVVLETLLDGTPDPGLTWTDLGTNLVIPNLFDPSLYAPNTTLSLTYSGGLAGTTCAATQLLELTILPDNVDAGNNNSITVCSSDPPFLMTPELGGTPNAGGLWESSTGTTFPSGQFAPGTNPSGTYSYTVSSSCGSDVAYLVITVVNILSPGTDGTLDICSGDVNVPLINGLGGAPYTPGTWSGPTPGATVNGAGVSDGDVYTYTVGSGSCAASATVTINLEATPFAGTAVTPPPVYCASDPSLPLATFLNPGPSSAGTWTGPGTFTGSTLNPSVHVTGNYTHTVTSANCGSDTETIFITIEPVPNAGNSTTVNACPNGIPVDLFAALGGGVSTPGIWTAPAGGPTNGIFTPVNVDPAGVYTYTVSSPSGLCTDAATVTVNYSTLPNPGINGSITVCASNPPFSLISILGGTPQTTGGTWFNPSFIIVPGGSNAQFNPASSVPGDYIYSLTAGGCPPVSSTVSIAVVPEPNAGTNTTVTRCEIEGLIDLFPLLNGSPDAGGTWTLAGGAVNPLFDITGQGGTSLVFVYTVGSGSCTSSANLTVTVTPAVNAGPDVVIPDLCAGGTLNLLTWLDPSAGTGSFSPSNTVPQVPASNGTYIYTVDGGSCPDDNATYTISIDPTFIATAGPPTCNGAQTSYTVTINISGGDGNYFVNGVSSGPTFTSAAQPLGPIYSFVVSDGGPCGNVTVTGPSPNCNCPATASFSGGNQSICAGESVDLELNLSPVVSGPFTVVYSIGGVAQPPLTGLVDGDVITVNPATTTTYALVSVEDQNCIGNASGSITLTVETPPNAGPDAIIELCATGGTLNMLNFLNPSAGPGAFAPSNTVPQIPASSGTYTYTSPGIACPNDQAVYTVNIDPAIAATASAVCNTAQTGYIVTFTPSGGDGTYTITGNPGSLVGGVFTSALIPTGDSYSFTIADGGLCADLTLMGGSPTCDCLAEGSVSGTTTICAGNSATLTFSLQGNGPFSVSYSNSNVTGNVTLPGIFNGHTITVNPSTTTTYTLQSVSDAGCVGTVTGAPVTITVNAPITTSNLQETCNNIGESYQVSFNVSGGSGSYNILPAGGQLAAGVYTSAPIPTGQTYNFTVNDTGPCPAITVTGSETCPCTSDAGTLNSGALEACANENIQVPATGNAVLDGNDLLQYVLHDGSATELGTIYATSNTGIFSFQGTMTLGVTYYIAAVVGNANGFGIVNLNHPCTDVSDGIPVIFNALPGASITGGAQVCPGEPVEFNISFTGEGPWDFSYAVNGSDSVNAFTSSPNYTITSTQPGTYTLGEVSDNNCVAMGTGSASLLNFTPPTAVLGGDPNICENSGDGPLVSLTGQAPWTFVYSIGGVEQPPVTSNFPNYTIPAEVDGTYALVSVEGPNCSGTATGSLAVTLLESPSAQITGGGAVCAGEVANFNVNLTGNGPWVVQYAVDGVPQQPLNITQPFFTFQSGIDGDYVISQVSDQNCTGEVISSAASLNVTPLPTGEITADNNILCFGQEVQLAFNLQGVGPFDIVYVINGDTIAVNGVPSAYVQTLTPQEPVVAELLYIQDGSVNGCTSEPNISTFIQVSELPNAPVLTNQSICAGSGAISIGTSAAPGLNYSWSPVTGLSDPNIANPQLTLTYAGLSSRTYAYIVTASNGECTAQDTAFITVEPGPQAYFTFSPDKISSEDPTVYFNNMSYGAPGLQYYWTFDSLDFSTARSPSYKFPDGITANYTVTLMATDTSTGCSGMYEREISIKPELLVYIPSAFTPDGDGLNDLWGPVMQNIDRNTYRLTVFDRYGEIVFETRDVDQKWRGDLMGSEYYVQTGVYVWLIETKNKTSLEEFELKGIVTVVR